MSKDATIYQKLKAPFPYFGGKSTIASIVWSALGQPAHYMEPFFGSGAVLLARPDYDPAKHTESICDKDGFICNVWRGLQYAPDEVAKWCDWPVNHADLNARRKRLLANEDRLLENLVADDEWFDAKLAGYWIWAACCWIGSGLTFPDARPHLSNAGKGVHAIGQVPYLSTAGQGVHAIGQVPRLGDAGRGVQEPYHNNIYVWFRRLSERLRRVRVVCGDWTRICGGNWQDNLGVVGMFFDPPYGITDRDVNIYHHDTTDVAAEVMAWCLARGSNPRYRIVLAGYEEHMPLIDRGWEAQNWKANGGYGHLAKAHTNENRHRECLYFSPHCLRVGQAMPLFAEVKP